MTNIVVGVVLVLVGVVHILPLVGLMGNEQLKSLYGVVGLDSNLTLLLRHRAVLFGLLGGSLLLAAFKPLYHWPALFIALVSMASFVLLALGQEDLSSAIERVVKVDIACMVALLAAILCKCWPVMAAN